MIHRVMDSLIEESFDKGVGRRLARHMEMNGIVADLSSLPEFLNSTPWI